MKPSAVRMRELQQKEKPRTMTPSNRRRRRVSLEEWLIRSPYCGFHDALTTTSPKFDGTPVSLSTTSRTPSGGLLKRSRTSLATRARVRGGKFSTLILPLLDPRLYCRYRLARAGPAVDDDMILQEKEECEKREGDRSTNLWHIMRSKSNVPVHHREEAKILRLR